MQGNTHSIYCNGEKMVEHTFSAEDHGCEGCATRYDRAYAREFAIMYPKWLKLYIDNIVMAAPDYMTNENAEVYETSDFSNPVKDENGNDSYASWVFGDGFTTSSWSLVNLNDIPDVIYGDANRDGKLDTNDVIQIMKYSAGWSSVTINQAAADVNVDGKVDTNDVILIMKFLAGWSGIVLGPPK